MPDYPDDDQILAQFQQEKQRDRAFQTLVRKYQQRLYWHVRTMVGEHEDADDVLQNVFLKAWKALPEFRGESKIFTWLYRIATNESITFLAQRKRRATVSIDALDSQRMGSLEADSFMDSDMAQERLRQAVERLPDKQRAVFSLKYFDEMKYKDMSEIMGTSVGALKASYHHAVKKVEEFLKGAAD